jgi:Fe-S-cluster containining protein
MKMKTRLPLLVQRSVAETKTARAEMSQSYELQLRSRLSEAGAEITCRKGCHHCCHYPVFITLLEGLALYQGLKAGGLWTSALQLALQQHAELTRGLATEVWALSLIACPLLDPQGLCSAYEDRPFACRVTYSVGNPSDCHPHTLGPGMLGKRELLQAITPTEREILHRHHLHHFRLPLSVATLLGERVATGELELEDCGNAILEMTNV